MMDLTADLATKFLALIAALEPLPTYATGGNQDPLQLTPKEPQAGIVALDRLNPAGPVPAPNSGHGYPGYLRGLLNR